MSKSTRKQAGTNNPTGIGGFGDNPQNRHPGNWRKDDTPRYKLEQMMKLNSKDMRKVRDDVNSPLFERKIAKALIADDWKTIREMVHEVYGTPKQTIDQKINVSGIDIVVQDE